MDLYLVAGRRMVCDAASKRPGNFGEARATGEAIIKFSRMKPFYVAKALRDGHRCKARHAVPLRRQLSRGCEITGWVQAQITSWLWQDKSQAAFYRPILR